MGLFAAPDLLLCGWWCGWFVTDEFGLTGASP
jgi:hypothetical protein